MEPCAVTQARASFFPYLSEDGMNSLDIIIFLTLFFFGLKGLIRGILIEVLTLAGLIVAYLTATRHAGFLTEVLSRHIPLPRIWLTVLGFSLVFILIVAAARIVSGALSRLIKMTPAVWLDRGGGAVFGLFKGALIVSLLALVISLVPLSEDWEGQKKRSVLYRPMLPVAPAVFDFSMRIFPRAKGFFEEIRDALETHTEAPGFIRTKRLIDAPDETRENERPVRAEKDDPSHDRQRQP